ncbi:hypothetical protein LWC34_42870 [Kibdelosporangium philippinense]|uniref:MarR family transcriptional regulator n=1 Tax=Kibdelosporangium philippinense TaxID=211113 RepID=A0ABS8ZUK4_9PSEU|nr:hypothetical protein [Kibdelosporangium philippinense]MCE7009507.1 hypothetical protein [Kibdelosporangium philippinense]
MARSKDANDRHDIQVSLTSDGCALTDRVVGVRLARERDLLANLEAVSKPALLRDLES